MISNVQLKKKTFYNNSHEQLSLCKMGCHLLIGGMLANRTAQGKPINVADLAAMNKGIG